MTMEIYDMPDGSPDDFVEVLVEDLARKHPFQAIFKDQRVKRMVVPEWQKEMYFVIIPGEFDLVDPEFLRFNKLAERNGWAFACRMGIRFCNDEVILRYVKRLPDNEDNNERK